MFGYPMLGLIKCLKLLSSGCVSLVKLAEDMGFNWLQMLELIAKTNDLEPGLVKTGQNCSFCLTRPIDWLDPIEVLNELRPHGLDNYAIKLLPEVDSTNTYAFCNLNNLSNRTIVVAELQSGGRGRGDKRWISKIATDLTVSFLYFFPLHFSCELLPLIAAVAVNRLLKQYRISNYIKWPNDIYLANGGGDGFVPFNGKIAGILLQSGIHCEQRFVIIGIGINNSFSWCRNKLLASLVAHMEHVVQEYSVFGFAMLRQEWLDNCLHYNKTVKLYHEQKLITSGLNTDLTLEGKLVVKNKNGEYEYISGSLSLLIDDMG